MDKKYMDIAYKEAEKAYRLGEVPVGCVITYNDKLLIKTHNLKEKKNCALYHAEILAIKKASKLLNSWRLDECDMYITLDPCVMCAGAIKNARIKNLYCGTNNFYSNKELIKSILEEKDNNSVVNFESNIDEERCSKILKDFFANKRC